MDTQLLPAASGVYRITCTANGKFYIGSTLDLSRRWSEHKRLLRNQTHKNKHLQNAWNKYGEHTFFFTVLEECDVDIVYEREQQYLDEYSSSKMLFNIAKDVRNPTLGRERTPETRAKIKKTLASPEIRAKIGATHKNKIVSLETRAKLRQAKLGKSNSPEAIAKSTAANLGAKRTPQGCANISASLKGLPKSADHREKLRAAHCKYIYVITSPDGEIFEAVSLKQFCGQHNLPSWSMSNAASGKVRHYKGWVVKRFNREKGEQ